MSSDDKNGREDLSFTTPESIVYKHTPLEIAQMYLDEQDGSGKLYDRIHELEEWDGSERVTELLAEVEELKVQRNEWISRAGILARDSLLEMDECGLRILFGDNRFDSGAEIGKKTAQCAILTIDRDKLQDKCVALESDLNDVRDLYTETEVKLSNTQTERDKAFQSGWKKGVTDYAIWKDGEQLVGCMQRSLKKVLDEGPRH
jgi:hypothetical protein